MNDDPTKAPETDPRFATGWNVVITSIQGEQGKLRRLLRRLLHLRRSPFPNVLLGTADDPDTLLARAGELRERRPDLDRCLGKLVPLERTFAVDLEHFESQLVAEIVPAVVDRLVGQSFHVRVERRGYKGQIDTLATEVALGAALHAALVERGAHPEIEFRDPDVVVAIEIMAGIAGFAVITREMKQRFPFLKVR